MSDWPEKEADLRAPVAAYLAGDGLTVRDEVWINGRIADLYGYDEDRTVAVELKLTDWKRALRQAVAYQLGALYTYVALPLIHVPRVMRQASALRSRSVGLLGVAPGTGDGFRQGDEELPSGPDEPDVREVLEPRPADRFLPFLAEKIKRDAQRPKRRPTHLPRDW